MGGGTIVEFSLLIQWLHIYYAHHFLSGGSNQPTDGQHVILFKQLIYNQFISQTVSLEFFNFTFNSFTHYPQFGTLIYFEYLL